MYEVQHSTDASQNVNDSADGSANVIAENKEAQTAAMTSSHPDLSLNMLLPWDLCPLSSDVPGAAEGVTTCIFKFF